MLTIRLALIKYLSFGSQVNDLLFGSYTVTWAYLRQGRQ